MKIQPMIQKTLLVSAIAFSLLTQSATHSLRAQGDIPPKDYPPSVKFKDIFLTAGYATAFGACLGLSTLAFVERPERHIKNVSIGASLGFIGGSLLGSYLVFLPLAYNEQNPKTQWAQWSIVPDLITQKDTEGRVHSSLRLAGNFSLQF